MVEYKCYWATDGDVTADPEPKMVNATLTPDPQINREALDQMGMLDFMDAMKDTFGAMMVGLKVEQGSDSANAISEAHARYSAKEDDK